MGFPAASYMQTALQLQLLLLLVARATAFLPPRQPFPSVHTFSRSTTSILRPPPPAAAPSFLLLQASSSSSNNIKNEIPTEWRGAVLKQLKNVIDPDLGSDIVTLGFVQDLQLSDDNDVVVSFNVELTTPACPVKDQFAADCERLVLDLPFVDRVNVTMTAQEITDNDDSSMHALSGMSQIGAVIAVSSCKGGVGKSTTAVNLAYSLQALGGTVGILDADVYGPSLPTMVTPDDDVVRFVGRQVAPLQRNGVRLMSFGYINDGSAVMRGPMVTQLLDQILSVTHWGALDYLVIDMPPGTGDIQLTLTQRLNITAAVIVTTPQELSFADVVRGIEMFDSVSVPCVAVVENMAYYEVPPEAASSTTTTTTNTLDETKLKQALVEKLREEGLELNGGSTMDKLANELVDIVVKQQEQQQQAQQPQQGEESPSSSRKVPIFGAGHKQRLSEQFGIEHTFSVPLLEKIAANGDVGTPYVLEHPDSPQAKIYQSLAGAVVSEVAKAKFGGGNTRPTIVYEEEDHVLLVNDDARLAPAALRRDCRCAACVEEMTGRQLLVKAQIPESIRPRKMYPTGNYALSVDWSDGHRSLYPYRQIQSLLQDQEEQTDMPAATAKAEKEASVVQ